MAVKLANNARSVLAQTISATDTQLRITTGHGVKFPTLTTADWFPIALENANGQIEYCRCTARNNDVFTVLRGAEGSQALGFSAGDAFELRVTVAALAGFVADAMGDLAPASLLSINTTSVG